MSLSASRVPRSPHTGSSPFPREQDEEGRYGSDKSAEESRSILFSQFSQARRKLVGSSLRVRGRDWRNVIPEEISVRRTERRAPMAGQATTTISPLLGPVSLSAVYLLLCIGCLTPVMLGLPLQLEHSRLSSAARSLEVLCAVSATLPLSGPILLDMLLDWLCVLAPSRPALLPLTTLLSLLVPAVLVLCSLSLPRYEVVFLCALYAQTVAWTGGLLWLLQRNAPGVVTPGGCLVVTTLLVLYVTADVVL